MERRKRLLTSLGAALWFLILLVSADVADCQDDLGYYSPNAEYDNCRTCPDEGLVIREEELLCRCDSNCTLYGDCCNSHVQSLNGDVADQLNGLLECRSVYLDERTQPGWEESFWMVSECPADWLAGRDDQLLLDILNNCSRGSDDLPPVTDLQTGLVYKNEYCAVCHQVGSFRQWGYTFECNQQLRLLTEQPDFQITLDVVQQWCLVCRFRDPHETNPTVPAARACVHPSLVEDSCLERERLEAMTDVQISEQVYQQELVSQCKSGHLSPVVAKSSSKPFRNQYCALCNGIRVRTLACVSPYTFRDETNHCELEAATMAPTIEPPTTEQTEPPTTTPTTQTPTTTPTTQLPTKPPPTNQPGKINITGEFFNIELPLVLARPPPQGLIIEKPEIIPPPFTVFVDPDRNSQTITVGQTTVSVTTTCEDGEVFDHINRKCRKTACPEVARGEPCILPAQLDESIAINGTNGTLNNNNSLFCDEEDESPIPLDDSEFILLDNETLEFGGEIFEIIGYSNGSAVICTNFSQNGTFEVNVTVLSYSYPESLGFTVLTYVGCSLSVIGCAVVLLTYSLFKELRTLPGKILMNLSAAILATSLFLVAVIRLFALSGKEELCHTTAIFLHWFVLSEFSWMTIMSVELARTLVRASRLRPTESDKVKRKIFLIYLLIGWGIPTLVAGLSVVLNYTTDYIQYGEDGFCWIGDRNSFFAVFLTPVVLSLLLNAAASFVTSYLLLKAQRGEAKLQKQHSTSYFRIHLSVFSVTGLTWVFGFVAILARNDWAWYIFLILTSTQGFTICAAFLFTKKVFSLYKERCWSRISSRFSLKSTLKQSTQDTSLAVRYVKKGENTSSVSAVSMKETEIGPAVEPSETNGQAKQEPVRYARDVKKQEEEIAKDTEQISVTSEREQINQEPVRYARDVKKQEEEIAKDTGQISVTSEREQINQEPVRYARNVKKQEEEIAKDTEQISVTSEREQTNQDPVRYAKKQDEERKTE